MCWQRKEDCLETWKSLPEVKDGRWPTEDVFASEGDTVTLDCTFETTRTSPTLFWYRQKCNDFPRYMLKSYSDKAEKASEFQTDRFNAAINGTSVPLKIQKLQLTDSAVYYCALRFPLFWFRLMHLVKLFKTFIGPFSNRPLHPTPTHYPSVCASPWRVRHIKSVPKQLAGSGSGL
uniref:Ig-like domain-containing protein n=1 Tax=Labrus bergylta TaxID=56723 RepID=A0A3Q3F5T6_9LABR